MKVGSSNVLRLGGWLFAIHPFCMKPNFHTWPGHGWASAFLWFEVSYVR